MELPASFVDYTRSLLGEEEYEKLAVALQQEPPVSIRFNNEKWKMQDEGLSAVHSPFDRVPWSSEGVYLDERLTFTFDPLFHAGCFYVQEASSMFVEQALRQYIKEPAIMLDLCAAPGGKSTHARSVLPEGSLLVANEVIRNRSQVLAENLAKWGHPDVVVTNNDPADFSALPSFFDVILTDVPCSGEGMFRKNPAVVDSWQEKGPEYFSKLQREIIVQAADMLLPGGMMFYSTCTFSPLENEKTITHLLKERPDMEVIPMEDYEGFAEGLTSYRGEVFDESCKLCRRIWPHKMSGEGHFMALLHKKSGTQQQVQQTVSQSSIWWEKCKGLNKEQKAAAEDFFSHVNIAYDGKRIDVRGDNLYYLPAPKYDGRGLHFLRNGLFMGEFKKKRFEPSQPFALALHAQDFDQVLDFPADDERLSRYLRGETLDVSDLIAGEKKRKGWQLVMVAGHPLGFGKLVNNNLKNKYPAGWRKNN